MRPLLILNKKKIILPKSKYLTHVVEIHKHATNDDNDISSDMQICNVTLIEII